MDLTAIKLPVSMDQMAGSGGWGPQTRRRRSNGGAFRLGPRL